MRSATRRVGIGRRATPGGRAAAGLPRLSPLEPRVLLAAQAQLVTDINTAPRDGNPTALFDAGDYVYFSADDGSSGRELYRTDGTAAGTIRLLDIFAGV